MTSTVRARIGFVLALALLLTLAPLGVRADHLEPVVLSPPPSRFDLDPQQQALRAELRGTIDLTRLPYYSIDATFDPASSTVRGEEVVRVANPGNGDLAQVVFLLLPNAASIYGGGSLTVQGVWRDGLPVLGALSVDRTVLTVTLAPVLSPGQSTELRIAFTASVPWSGSGYGIFSRSQAVTSLAGWYPVLAPYHEGWRVSGVPTVGDANHFDAALYDVVFRAPSVYTVVGTGSTLQQTVEEDVTSWRIVSGPARGLTLILSDRFEQQTTEQDGVTLNYYSLPPAVGVTSPDAAMQIAVDAFSVYEQRFGQYPYLELDIVESQVNVGGYEFAGMVAIENSLRSRGSVAQLRFVVAHEIAHQWWFALVGSNPVEEPWLDEALATYSVAVYAEDARGVDAGRAMVASFRPEGGSPSGSVPGIAVSAMDYASWVAYRGPVYYRGALFMDALRNEMGDEGFFAMLQEYVRSFRFGMATTRDLTGLAEHQAGRELDELFRLWFGTGDPGA